MGIADLLARFEAAKKADDTEQIHRLRTMIIRSVHLVSRGANRRNFAVRKGEDPAMLTNDIIGLDIISTANGVVTVGKANRDKVAAELQELAKKLSDPDADDEELAAAAKAITTMLSAKADGDSKDDEELVDEEEKGDAKKAKDGEDTEEGEEEKGDAKKAKFKGPPEDATAEDDAEGEKQKKSDGDQVNEAFNVIVKAGRAMSTGRMTIFQKALTLLQKVAEDMDPQEAQKMAPFMAVAKALTEEQAPEEIPGGNAATSVAKGQDRPKGRKGWTFGVNINDPDLHRDTADPTTSFFEK